MINILELATGLVAGILLGGLYFGGLWWTVRQLPHAQHFWRVYFGGLLVRLALVLPSFYVILTVCGWQSLATCLFGFILSRLVLLRVLGRWHSCPTERVT